MKKLKEYRKAAGLNQGELADILEVQQPYISRLERGEADCKLSFIHKAASYFGVTIFELLGEDDKQ